MEYARAHHRDEQEEKPPRAAPEAVATPTPCCTAFARASSASTAAFDAADPVALDLP
jgi:hypothetical protein